MLRCSYLFDKLQTILNFSAYLSFQFIYQTYHCYQLSRTTVQCLRLEYPPTMWEASTAHSAATRQWAVLSGTRRYPQDIQCTTVGRINPQAESTPKFPATATVRDFETVFVDVERIISSS